jgi:hypothetical protein
MQRRIQDRERKLGRERVGPALGFVVDVHGEVSGTRAGPIGHVVKT